MTDQDHRDEMAEEAQWLLDLDGYEGPIDLLLTLARAQKVDLAEISILALVDQYLEFIGRHRRLRIDLAADYLVMAAWLAYLKSRLLLPKTDDSEEPSGEALAARLALQLRRLEALRTCGGQLMARNRLGRDVFAHGKPEGLKTETSLRYDASFYDLLEAYAQIKRREEAPTLSIPARPVVSLEAALARLERLVGKALDWTRLERFLPDALPDVSRRSHLASTFSALLELARGGRIDIAQDHAFAPLYLKVRD